MSTYTIERKSGPVPKDGIMKMARLPQFVTDRVESFYYHPGFKPPYAVVVTDNQPHIVTEGPSEYLGRRATYSAIYGYDRKPTQLDLSDPYSDALITVWTEFNFLDRDLGRMTRRKEFERVKDKGAIITRQYEYAHPYIPEYGWGGKLQEIAVWNNPEPREGYAKGIKVYSGEVLTFAEDGDPNHWSLRTIDSQTNLYYTIAACEDPIVQVINHVDSPAARIFDLTKRITLSNKIMG